MSPKICVGTAAFGMDYGVTNESGQVAGEEVGKILKESMKAGITYLDTAQGYGNAESILGYRLPKKSNFKIVSKMQIGDETKQGETYQEKWDIKIKSTLDKLKLENIDSLLIHNPQDIKGNIKKYLWEWLDRIKKQRLVKNVGVSIYEAKDLEEIDLALIDVVQLPLSIYDQRLIKDGTIERLAGTGIKIHARSLFLQGLGLATASQWPKWVNTDTRRHHERLEHLARCKKTTLLGLALGFAKMQKNIESIVVGVTSQIELKEIVNIMEKDTPWMEEEWLTWEITNKQIIDPRRWPRNS